MRKEAKTENQITIPRLNGYHGGHYDSLKFYNSDRVVLLNSNYTVSSENTRSTLSIIKEGSKIGGVGFEVELVSDMYNKVVLCNLLTMVFEKLFPNDLFKFEEDCTVDAECVSQVMSKAFIRNNYKNFKSMYNDYFPAFGITANDSRCGMHTNISLSLLGKDERTQLENARKIGYLINHHYDFFKVAVYRNVTEWCPRMNPNKEYWMTSPLIAFPTGHSSCCVNFGHVRQGYIEIRLVGGQKNFACFRNTCETIFHLIDVVKKLSWNDLDDLTKVFKGCNNYVFDRIADNCFRANVISLEDVEKIRPTVKVERFI